MKYMFESYNSGPDLHDDPFHLFSPEEWELHTPTQMRTYLIQHLPNPLGPSLAPSGPISPQRPTRYSSAAIELMVFKMGIKERLLHTPH